VIAQIAALARERYASPNMIADHPFMKMKVDRCETVTTFACDALAQVHAGGEEQGELKMTRVVFAMVVAAILTFAVSGGSQAAPIAPLSSAVTVDQGNVTPVYWYHHRWYRHHRRCWRGRYGRVHCRWW
jgi:hypothetical protein